MGEVPDPRSHSYYMTKLGHVSRQSVLRVHISSHCASLPLSVSEWGEKVGKKGGKPGLSCPEADRQVSFLHLSPSLHSLTSSRKSSRMNPTYVITPIFSIYFELMSLHGCLHGALQCFENYFQLIGHLPNA